MGTTVRKLDPRWPVPSRPPVSLPEARPPGSSWLPRLPGSLHLPPVESRSPTGTGLEPSPSVRSVVTRNPPSFSSVNSPSRGSREKTLRTSKLISDSRVQPSVPFRRPAKLTWSVCSKTPTCAQSTPSVRPLCQRIFSWHEESAERGLKKLLLSFLQASKYETTHPQKQHVCVHLLIQVRKLKRVLFNFYKVTVQKKWHTLVLGQIEILCSFVPPAQYIINFGIYS